MMTRTGRRRLPILLALAGAALALLLSPVQAQDGSAPAKPTGLTAAVSHDSVTLTWDDPGDDSITGYVVLRRDKNIHEEGTFVTVVPDTASADTTYTDDTVEAEKQYVYRIKAISADGLSEISSWVRAYTPGGPHARAAGGALGTHRRGLPRLGDPHLGRPRRTTASPATSSCGATAIPTPRASSLSWRRTRAAPPPPTPTTAWRLGLPTPTASRPATPTG